MYRLLNTRVIPRVVKMPKGAWSTILRYLASEPAKSWLSWRRLASDCCSAAMWEWMAELMACMTRDEIADFIRSCHHGNLRDRMRIGRHHCGGQALQRRRDGVGDQMQGCHHADQREEAAAEDGHEHGVAILGEFREFGIQRRLGEMFEAVPCPCRIFNISVRPLPSSI